MNINIRIYTLLIYVVLLAAACSHSHEHANGHEEHEHGEEEHGGQVHFTEQQFESLGMKVDTLPMRNMSSYVESNGQLEVPPQNEASVTAIIGANVTSIEVIEGDEISAGQALAYLSHPDLIKLQTDYINSRNQLGYLEKEYMRQKRLYEENVGSGKNFQKVQTDFQVAQSTVKGLEAQLKLLGLNLARVREQGVYEKIAVRSPISGSVRMVMIKTAQYVAPQTEMFEIVNIDHIHADLMVFEKDVHKVKKGQKVRFTIGSLPERELFATVYSVGRSFEQNPKAIHLHAEIENKEGLLIPGMYVKGRILTDDVRTIALPEEGVVREGDKYFLFTASKETEDEGVTWAFEPVEIIPGIRDNGWVEVKLLDTLPVTTVVAWNNAYYLMAEMKKGEAGHHH